MIDLLKMLRLEIKDLHDYIDIGDVESIKSCKNAITILEKIMIELQKEVEQHEMESNKRNMPKM